MLFEADLKKLVAKAQPSDSERDSINRRIASEAEGDVEATRKALAGFDFADPSDCTQYSNLVEALAGTGPVQLAHNLESVKILPPYGQNPPHLYGDITAESVARAEVQNPVQNRVVCLTVSATDDRDRGRPSSWSAALSAAGTRAPDRRP